MEISILQGTEEFLDDCFEILVNSKLGEIYFSDKNPRNMLIKGLKKEEIYIAVDEKKECVGFIWCQLDGVFGKYPYIHIIMVKSIYQGYGIGKKLIKYIEDEVCSHKEKIFLMVGDFNTGARKLYENLGYNVVGMISGFYKEGVDEYLMEKSK